ncbi:MAG: hypothetical protein ACOCZR_00835, partial [Halanaerobiales bacterium]
MPGNGWIKLYRKLQDSDMYRELNSKQRDVMINCLLLANHKGKKWEWKGEIFKCRPGQFITSLPSLKRVCAKDVSVQNIRTALKKLIKWNFLEQETTKTGRLITIINWQKYQESSCKTNSKTNRQITGDKSLNNGVNSNSNNKTNSHNNRQSTDNQQTTNSQLTSNKNVKNDKNDKEENNIVPSAEIDKIYNSINGRWTNLFEEYIDVYRSKNKTNKITDNKHYRLLNELYQILQSLEFKFDGQEYELTKDIFEEGVNKTIEAGAANINY